MTQTRTPADNIEALLNLLDGRYDEYWAALGGISFADPSGKLDLMRAADNKLVEIDEVEKQVREAHEAPLASLTSRLDSPSARLMHSAAQKAGWVDVPATDAFGIKLWCEDQVRPVREWPRRQEAVWHLRFALRNARQGDEAKVVEHLRNAKRLIEA